MKSLRTVSLKRYRVEGEMPDPASDAFARKLKDKRFLPLGANEERTYGWVSPENLLLTEFDPEVTVRGGRAVLSFRIDRRRPSARLLRAQMDLEVRARLRAARDEGKPFRFSREERQQVRKDLQAEMLRQTNPSVEAYGALYDPARRTVTLLTLGRAANEVFRVLFRDTFDADLRLLTPWRRGVELLEGTSAAGALDSLRRSEFRPEAAGSPSRLRTALPAPEVIA
jgi:hypothetical protein